MLKISRDDISDMDYWRKKVGIIGDLYFVDILIGSDSRIFLLQFNIKLLLILNV